MKITIVSGSRADAGPLRAVQAELLLGGHQVTWFNLGVQLHTGNNRFDSCNTTAEATMLTAAKLRSEPPDLVMLLGDRYEILGAATAAFLMGLPIAHLSGGDVTHGSQDDSIRHAITKLSHLHFTTCLDSSDRIRDMGETESSIHTVGCPGVDALLSEKLPPVKPILEKLDLYKDKFFLVGYHPDTINDASSELTMLFSAIFDYPMDVDFVLLNPNKDTGYKLIEGIFSNLAVAKNVVYVNHGLPRLEYLSLLNGCVALIGNSSAGRYEAPYFGTPVLEIGARQAGRVLSENVSLCPNIEYLRNLMGKFLEGNRPLSSAPYGDGHSAEDITRIISGIADPKQLLKKYFHDI